MVDNMFIDLHCHTTFSHGTKILYDGVNTPEEMVLRAKSLGLGAIAITDHNTMNGIPFARKAALNDLLIVPGEEITSAGGHILAIGINESIKPGLQIEETVDRIHEQGGVAIASHPFDIRREGLRYNAYKCDAVEVFNAMNLDRISNNKCIRFAQKKGLTGVAGSDAHSVDMLGNGLTKCDTSSIDSVVNSIKHNHITIQTRYASTRVVMELAVNRLKLSYDDVIAYIDKNYIWPKKVAYKHLLGLVNKSPGGIDRIFRIAGYTAFGSIVMYSIMNEIFGIRK